MSRGVQPEDALTEAIRAIVRAELARALDVSSLGVFSDETPASYPPGKRTRRAARDAIVATPGAETIGRGRATVHRVSRAAYLEHHARRAPAAPARRIAATSDDQIAAMAIDSAMLRPTTRRAS